MLSVSSQSSDNGHRTNENVDEDATEIIIGLVGPIGAELEKVKSFIKTCLAKFRYKSQVIKISEHIIRDICPVTEEYDEDEYKRIDLYMRSGNDARKYSNNNAVLALGVATYISNLRTEIHPHFNNRAFIIDSLKRPEEVEKLREIYPGGFFLIGIYAEEKQRHEYLTGEKGISIENAWDIIQRDSQENIPYGQNTTDTFHLSDFFVVTDGDDYKLRNSIERIINIIFGHPYVTPTFDEYAMFIAFCASLRSASLARQVGAVVARDNEILSTGANDCPKYGVGLYWLEYNTVDKIYCDLQNGRDHERGFDSNTREKNEIINDIANKIASEIGTSLSQDSIRDVLTKSRISDLTEYGRAVHAEMEAILSCARNCVSSKGATLYTTTFPCHNCARHIIAAGFERVVYIEPYPKSRATSLHDDAIEVGFSTKTDRLHFEPFVGVGPRCFFDLFSMSLGSGYKIKRKEKNGDIVNWDPSNAKLRLRMKPLSYIKREYYQSAALHTCKNRIMEARNNGS